MEKRLPKKVEDFLRELFKDNVCLISSTNLDIRLNCIDGTYNKYKLQKRYEELVK